MMNGAVRGDAACALYVARCGKHFIGPIGLIGRIRPIGTGQKSKRIFIRPIRRLAAKRRVESPARLATTRPAQRGIVAFVRLERLIYVGFPAESLAYGPSRGGGFLL